MGSGRTRLQRAGRRDGAASVAERRCGNTWFHVEHAHAPTAGPTDAVVCADISSSYRQSAPGRRCRSTTAVDAKAEEELEVGTCGLFEPGSQIRDPGAGAPGVALHESLHLPVSLSTCLRRDTAAQSPSQLCEASEEPAVARSERPRLAARTHGSGTTNSRHHVARPHVQGPGSGLRVPGAVSPGRGSPGSRFLESGLRAPRPHRRLRAPRSRPRLRAPRSRPSLRAPGSRRSLRTRVPAQSPGTRDPSQSPGTRDPSQSPAPGTRRSLRAPGTRRSLRAPASRRSLRVPGPRAVSGNRSSAAVRG